MLNNCSKTDALNSCTTRGVVFCFAMPDDDEDVDRRGIRDLRLGSAEAELGDGEDGGDAEAAARRHVRLDDEEGHPGARDDEEEWEEHLQHEEAALTLKVKPKRRRKGLPGLSGARSGVSKMTRST